MVNRWYAVATCGRHGVFPRVNLTLNRIGLKHITE
jgi:hypothetical protein